MQMCFLGTGSAIPTPKRNVSSLVLKLEDGSVWLFDCGEGTQIQIQKSGTSFCKITKIFITHLHGDHVFGLPGILCTISSKVADRQASLQLQTNPCIEIYGPLGLRRLINTSLCLSNSFLNFDFKIHELEPAACQHDSEEQIWNISNLPNVSHPNELPGSHITSFQNSSGNLTWSVCEDEQFVIESGWIKHCIPCFGFVIKEKDKAGTLLVEKLKALGVKQGPLYGKLKSGLSITTESGLHIESQDVMTPPLPGKIIGILGDTSDASSMAHITNHCDVLVHESTHDDSLMEKALQYGHSTPRQAAKMAKEMGAKTLILNHFSQRYVDEESSEKTSTSLLKMQAECALKDTDTIVICASDLFTFEIKRHPRISNIQ